MDHVFKICGPYISKYAWKLIIITMLFTNIFQYYELESLLEHTSQQIYHLGEIKEGRIKGESSTYSSRVHLDCIQIWKKVETFYFGFVKGNLGVRENGRPKL